jgi:hypothetical protein
MLSVLGEAPERPLEIDASFSLTWKAGKLIGSIQPHYIAWAVPLYIHLSADRTGKKPRSR